VIAPPNNARPQGGVTFGVVRKTRPKQVVSRWFQTTWSWHADLIPDILGRFVETDSGKEVRDSNVGVLLQAGDPGRLPPFRYQNIVDGNAISIALTGMLIVFTALALISLFIGALPRILSALEPHFPVVEHHPPAPAEGLPSDEERIVAAIGTVLHAETKRAASR